MGTVKKRILHVDLSTNEVTTSDFTAKGLLGLGGKALGVALLERHLDPRIDPLAPGNPVIFTSSPLAAYGFSGSNRLGAFTKSPLTGAFLESYSGGTMARTLCETEWDALVITGAAASPVRVDVDSAGAQIRAADNLWGQDVFTADDSIREDLERRSSTLVIGPAGETKVAFAAAMLEKYHALGRGGLGAVLGSKRMKAMTVTSPGSKRNKGGEVFDQVRRKISKLATEDPVSDAYRRLGTPMMVAVLNEAGGFPTDYWSKGTAAHRDKLEAENYSDWAKVENDTCPPCPIRCRRRLVFKDNQDEGRVVHGPEFETLYAFGGLCLVEHARDVVLLHEECNRLGMDTMSAGNVIALAAKAGEEGKIKDAPLLGDADGIMTALGNIARRNGATEDALAGGIREAARFLGMESAAIHVKGMEPAGYDPRALKGMALAYATSPRGACHLRATFYKPELGGLTKDLSTDGLADLFVDYEDRLFLHDCLIMCRFYRDFLPWEDLQVIVGELNGAPVTQEDLATLTQDLLTRIRRLNFAMGLSPDDDTLPSRFFDEALDDKPCIDRQEFRATLRAYYLRRGWGETGDVLTGGSG